MAIDLLGKADLFFISSSHYKIDMDTNHRGGPPGFVRILKNDKDGLILVYPEYSGNRLYQTLGNLNTTPRAGLVFPNFETGDVLYVTGTTEILYGKDAASIISHTNLAVKLEVKYLRFVTNGLGFRGQDAEFSPYNPAVRYLTTETRNTIKDADNKKMLAKLTKKELITPTIGRFRFHISDPKEASSWKPGQYVALSFQEELDIGWSHMRNDDPKSLNDDYLRTFTVSSRHSEEKNGIEKSEFEITARRHGPVTSFLFKTNPKAHVEVPILGFGGEFFIEQDNQESVAFVAAGVGITPLLAQADDLDLERLKLYWTIKGEDLAFVKDTFERIPALSKATTLFITGAIKENGREWKSVSESGADVQRRRMLKSDLEEGVDSSEVKKWYLCTGTAFRKVLLAWLVGKKTLYEDFNY